MPAPDDDLARTRRAFQRWRANRQGRSRIPPELWRRAAALLAHFPVSRVARELRLDPIGLKKRRPAVPAAAAPDTSTAPRFFALRAADLSQRTDREPHREVTASSDHLTEGNLRLVIEHAAGHRLLLSLPAAEWVRVEALCTFFLRER